MTETKMRTPPRGYDDMTPMQFKAYENRLRRWARRRGWMLVKTRRRDSGALGFDQYLLVEATDEAFEAVKDELIARAQETLQRGEGHSLKVIERQLGYKDLIA